MEQGEAISDLRGYWWQCTSDASHVERQFEIIASKPLVEFFYELAQRGWDQALLRKPCNKCPNGEMRITYDFPRKVDRVRLSLIHAVGLSNSREYLPMVWETVPLGQTESWFDFKYVGWSSERGFQSYGLAKPAVFSRAELRQLFDTYRQVIGGEILP